MLALLSLSLSLVPDEKKCAVPPAVARAHQPELRDGGYTAQYQCIHGYQIVDSDKATKATITCDRKTGNWQQIPICER